MALHLPPSNAMSAPDDIGTFSAPAPPKCSLKKTAWETHDHILDAHRIYCKQDLLRNRNASQTIIHGQSKGEGHFFGISKSDLAGEELSFRHLSVRPSCSQQSLGIASSYTRRTNGWTIASSAQTSISRKFKLWTFYYIPGYRIFTFLVLRATLTLMVLLWSTFW